MTEYIDRQAAKEKLCGMCRWEGTSNCDECEHPIDDIPAAADVRENVKGEWKAIIVNETFAECKCTNCGAVEYFNHGWKKFNFCPNCGADMI